MEKSRIQKYAFHNERGTGRNHLRYDKSVCISKNVDVSISLYSNRHEKSRDYNHATFFCKVNF